MFYYFMSVIPSELSNFVFCSTTVFFFLYATTIGGLGLLSKTYFREMLKRVLKTLREDNVIKL